MLLPYCAFGFPRFFRIESPLLSMLLVRTVPVEGPYTTWGWVDSVREGPGAGEGATAACGGIW